MQWSAPWRPWTEGAGDTADAAMERAEGSGLPGTTRDGSTHVDAAGSAEAYPTEERLRQMERHKARKEAGLEKHAYKKEKKVEQHFDDCGDDLKSIIDPRELHLWTADTTSGSESGSFLRFR